ncbi:MAG: hypothetical protein V4650_10025 [Pseudomonadota bacterium]
MHSTILSALLTAALLLTGCAATQAQRIERNPEVFAGLSPEQQQKVRDGQVAVGFDEAAVRLAVGEPDRIVERETIEGLSQVWVYLSIAPGFHNNAYCAPGLPYYGHASYCRPLSATQYEERARISFKDGKVVSVERQK